MKATDLEISIIREVEIKGGEDDDIVIPARTVVEIIKSLPEGVVEFVLVKAESKVKILSEKINYEVKAFLSEDFPKVEKKEGKGFIEVKSSKLNEAIRQVVRAVSKDETRPVLTGVLFEIKKEGYRMIATDGYRLAIKNCKEKNKIKDEREVLIPGRSLEDLSKLMGEDDKVKIYFEENSVSWEMEKTQLQTRLIEGSFPDYEQLLPKTCELKVKARKEAIMDSVKRVSIVSQDDPLRLKIEKDKIIFLSESKDVGRAEEEVEADIEGEPVEMAFNPGYLSDGISSVSTEKVVLEIQDKLKPCVIKEKDGQDFMYVVMPVRVG